MVSHKLLFFFLLALGYGMAQENKMIVTGTVISKKDGEPIEGAAVRLSNSVFAAVTDQNGTFTLTLPGRPLIRLLFSHVGYEPQVEERRAKGDSILNMRVSLVDKNSVLDTVSVVAVHQPETLVGKPMYSVFDFDFYEDKYLLLTSEGALKRAQVRLSDSKGNILSTYQLPAKAGEALHFYHDYEGYTDVVCKDSVFRLDVMGDNVLLMTVPRPDFEKYLKHIADTANGHYYYSNQWDQYPSFNYYSAKRSDTVSTLLKVISNNDLMKLYNMEYYYLPSRMQLEARRIADYYKTDRRIIAAMMSGFTNSWFYEPLYAPLFILNDTICIFNHYNDFLYHYTRENKLIDSVKIDYHHPKNWREWKKKLYVDEVRSKVYAFFSKDGHHYLKQINYQTGKEVMTYKLQHHSADKIKVKDGYVYYIYRPFGSTQEKFLYRERIE